MRGGNSLLPTASVQAAYFWDNHRERNGPHLCDLDTRGGCHYSEWLYCWKWRQSAQPYYRDEKAGVKVVSSKQTHAIC